MDLCHFIKRQRKEQKELIWTEAGRGNQEGKRQREGKEGKQSVEVRDGERKRKKSKDTEAAKRSEWVKIRDEKQRKLLKETSGILRPRCDQG